MDGFGFLTEVLDFKDERRAGASILGVEDAETVAGHSWNMAFLAIVFSGKRDLDLEKALKMAIIHDLAEYKTGDLINTENYSDGDASKQEKQAMEEKVWNKISETLGYEFHRLWQEYEQRGSKEAKLIKDMDMIEHYLQISWYQDNNKFSEKQLEKLPDDFVEEMFSNSIKNLETQYGEEIIQKIESCREKLNKNQSLNQEEQKVKKLYDVLSLKREKRSGQQIYNVQDPSSIAAHSWSVAFLTILYGCDELDLEYALKLAIIHDIGESEIGDIAYRAESGLEINKKQEEKEAVQRISEKTCPEIIELYKDYADRKSKEAKLVKDMDLIETVLQTLKYEKENRYTDNPEANYEGLDEFFETPRNRFNTEKGLKLFEKIEEKYLQEKQK